MAIARQTSVTIECDQPRNTKCVAMMVPGGLEHSGGIGRWAGYVLATWQAQRLQPPIEIIDTRNAGGKVVAGLVFARALGRLIRLRLKGELGIIHANLSSRGSTARKYIIGLLARLLGVKMVLHLHGSGYSTFYESLPPWARQRVRSMFRQSVHIIVLGESWATWVADTFSLPREKITVLYNGVPMPVRTTRHDSSRPCHIVMLGRIGARKGVPELLEALSTEALRSRKWYATLAGDGDVQTYVRMAESLELLHLVTFPGWLNQGAAAALIADADILVLPSYAENFPMSVIEALASRVAVVTTAVGTTPELLADGESACFVPVGESAPLATVLAELIDDPVRRHRIAHAGYQVFADNLNIDVLASELCGLYARHLASA